MRFQQWLFTGIWANNVVVDTQARESREEEKPTSRSGDKMKRTLINYRFGAKWDEKNGSSPVECFFFSCSMFCVHNSHSVYDYFSIIHGWFFGVFASYNQYRGRKSIIVSFDLVALCRHLNWLRFRIGFDVNMLTERIYYASNNPKYHWK